MDRTSFRHSGYRRLTLHSVASKLNIPPVFGVAAARVWNGLPPDVIAVRLRQTAEDIALPPFI